MTETAWANVPDGYRHLAEKREENRKLFRQEREARSSEARSSRLEKDSRFLASEREPAVFLLCYLSSFCCQKEESKSVITQ